jgi:hypothetical protein
MRDRSPWSLYRHLEAGNALGVTGRTLAATGLASWLDEVGIHRHAPDAKTIGEAMGLGRMSVGTGVARPIVSLCCSRTCALTSRDSSDQRSRDTEADKGAPIVFGVVVA